MENILNLILDKINNTYLEDGCEFPSDDGENFGYELLADLDDDTIDWNSGASKMVIIPKNENYVVKIPFNGYYNSIYDEDENGEEKYIDDEFIEFSKAGDENGWDYCEVEAKLYEEAEDRNLEQCFAKTEWIGDAHGYPIYKQEKAEIFGMMEDDSIKRRSDEEKNSAKKQLAKEGVNIYHICIDWVLDFIEYYGKEMLYKFMDFLTDFHIGDLHSDNIGYINGRPVLVDYSGFYD